MKIQHVECDDHRHTTILVEGLRRQVTLMHITDSHMYEADERDPEAIEAAVGYKARFPDRENTLEVFRQAMGRAREVGAEFLALTGDQVNFPAYAALEHLEREIRSLDLPYIYTLGNHDWVYPSREHNHETRAAYYPRFHRFTEGNPAFAAKEVGGLLMIGLDNSLQQVSEEQLEFLRRQLATGRPCLLFMHIPMYVRALMPDIVKKWKGPNVMGAEDGWTQAASQRSYPDVEPATRACVKLITEGAAENLIGIFTGHVHFVHADEFREGRFQYITDPGLRGGYRVVTIKPLKGSGQCR